VKRLLLALAILAHGCGEPAFADERGIDRLREAADYIGTPSTQAYCLVQDSTSTVAKRKKCRDLISSVMGAAGQLCEAVEDICDLDTEPFGLGSLEIASAAAFRAYIGAGSGSGDVVGPASSTDHALCRFDLTTGKLIQNSTGILSDGGALTGLASVSVPDLTAPAASHLQINAPSGNVIRWRINNVTQASIEAGGLVPGSAGGQSLGRLNLGWDGFYVDSSSSVSTGAFVGGALSANRTYTTQDADGTLAFLSDIPTIDKAFVDALNVDADTLDGLDSTAFALAGSGVTDHGALSGLADDDHTQYHNDARGDARYSLLAHDHDADYSPLFTDSAGLAALLSDENGSGGGFVRATSPTLTTPNIGAATGTSLDLATGAGPIVLANGAKLHLGGATGSGWSLRQTVSGVTVRAESFGDYYAFNGSELFSNAPLGTAANLGTAAKRWGAGYFSGLVRASSLNLTLGGTELALATGEVAMFTSRAASSNNAIVGINSGATGVAGLRFYDDGALTSAIYSTNAAGTAGLDIYPDFTSAGSQVLTFIAGANGFLRYTDNAFTTLLKLDHATAGIETAGKFTNYNNIATVSNGVPSIHAGINSTGNTAAKTTAALYTPPTDGFYRVSFAITLTTAATVSSVVGAGVNLNYTSGDGSVAKVQNVPMNLAGVTTATTDSGDTTNTVGTTLVGWTTVYADTVAMTYDVGYTSVGATAMQYAVRARVERL
jgi:hypothetical protein